MTRDDEALDPLVLSNQLCFSVYSTAHAFTRLYRELLGSLDVTYTQYLVLLALWEHDGLSVKQLGERLRLDSGTLTPLLRRLEAAGYVRRSRDRDDERRLRVHLTERAAAARPEVERVRRTVFDATGFSQAELEQLRRRLEALRAALDAASERGSGGADTRAVGER